MPVKLLLNRHLCGELIWKKSNLLNFFVSFFRSVDHAWQGGRKGRVG